MTWQVVCLNEVQPTTWRNGGGTTRELLAWPDSVAWQWRASVADVVRSGPFSSFVAVQRWFAVLQGDGVCLTIDGQEHRISTGSSPLVFDGAAATTCDLLGGATQDFNLMTQAASTARMLRISGDYRMTTDTSKIIAAYTHTEKATLQIANQVCVLSPQSFGWMHVDSGVAIHISASDALLMEIQV